MVLFVKGGLNMTSIQITMKDVQNSSAIEQQIKRRCKKIFQIYRDINHCHIVIDTLQRHSIKPTFNIRLLVSWRGKDIIVNRKSHKDLYLVVRETFSALKRQLKSHTINHKMHRIPIHAEKLNSNNGVIAS